MVALSMKICLLGDYAVGKTSLVRRFVYNIFEDRYLSTIGVKVSRKLVAVPRGDDVAELTMMLWDLAGSEEFDQIRVSYLRGAAGALVVCDMTNRQTLDHAREYVAQIRTVNPKAAVVIAANKQDLFDLHVIKPDEVAETAAELQAACCLTSAKTGLGVEDTFRTLGRLAIGA